MPAYPIEVINFGDPSLEVHHEVIRELNSLQEDFIFSLPPERYSLWAAPFTRDDYETTFIWEKLRTYRRECKGFHPYIIAIIHGRLFSSELGNIFGSHEAKEGIAVVTTADWDSIFAPPSLSTFLTYYLIRYTMSFICRDIKSHIETRSCFFDKKIMKNDIKLSMFEGKICDVCRAQFENNIDGHTYNSLLKLIKHLKNKANLASDRSFEKPKVFIGSSSEGLGIAENLQLGLDSVAECTIWSQGIFGLSRGNLENLVESARSYDYAILILTPDDPTTKRGQILESPRDNIIFELGLFIGSIGRDHTFIVKCREDKLDLPSDLDGVSRAEFSRRSDGNLEAALGPACVKLKKAMNIR